MSQRLALLIGNNEYHDPSLAKLVSPPQDVIQLGELLRDPAIGGFDRVDTLENQSFATVRRAIASFFTNNNRDDLLVLYFSGHGVLDDNGQLYLAVEDTERELLSATSIEAPFITGLMDRSISRRQVLALDCCHSGAFGRSKGGLGASVGTATTFEGKGYGRIILTASDATQYAWDGDDLVGEAQTSVFTRHLVEGLRSGAADMDADGQITLDELYDYVYEKVVAETPRQTPAKWSYRQQGTIVIAHNPSPVVQPAKLPAELVAAMESPFAGIRQGAVHDLQRLYQGSDRSMAYAAELALQEIAKDDSRSVSAAAQAALASLAPPKEESPDTSTADTITPQELFAPESAADMSPPAEQEAGTPVIDRSADTAAVIEPAVVKRTGAESKPSSTGSAVPLLAERTSAQRRTADFDYRPYLLVAAGVSLGEISALMLALLLNSMAAYFVGLALAGFTTGYLLLRESPRYRLGVPVILAVSWSVPYYLSFFTATTFYILAAVCLSYSITALAILLRPQFLSTQSVSWRSLLDLRRIGIAVVAGLAGTLAGYYLGAVPYSISWETFVGALISSYTPSDVVGSVYITGYFSIAISAILGAIVLCVVLYLLVRYLPLPSSAGAEAALSGAATGSIPARSPAVRGVKPEADVSVESAVFAQASPLAAAFPYLVIVLGWSISWVLSLALAQILNSGNALFLAWFAGGFFTGAILFKDMISIRWRAAAVLGACWLIPYLLLGGLIDILANFGVFDSYEASSRLFVIATSILVGFGTSMLIFFYLNKSRRER